MLGRRASSGEGAIMQHIRATTPAPAAVSQGRGRFTPPPLTRLRFQVPLLVLATAVLPALAIGDYSFYDITAATAASNSFYSSLICSVVALLLFRRLSSLPGVSSFRQVTPVVLPPFVAALFIIWALRLNYSIPILVMGAGSTCACLFGLWIYRRRKYSPTLYTIPGTRLSTPHAQTVELVDPTRVEPLEGNSVIVADLSDGLSETWEAFLLNAALNGVPVFHARSIQESLTGKVEIKHLSENSFGSVVPSMLYLKVKRSLDLTFAVLAAPFVLLLFLFIAAAIKLDSPGPVFFIQRRMGFRGVTFRMVKFRTMRPTGTLGECVESAKTKTGDERITRVGRVLRKYRLDELPQIWNIFVGEMSWIGPRPEATELSSWYHAEIPFYGYRHMVRPGLTGWAQVNQGHVVEVSDVTEKLYYDFYYIKYFSFWLDALIALKTVKTLLVGNGAK